MHPSKPSKRRPLIIVCIIIYVFINVILFFLSKNTPNTGNQTKDNEYISNSKHDRKYDYIVIGSGTGGVIATRLAEAGYDVLLIEAGPDDATYSCNNCNAYPYGNMYKGTISVPFKDWWFKDVVDLKWFNISSMPSYWNYNKTKLHRTESIYRAKMLGGCLSHNGHAWTRGDIRDYDYVSHTNNLPDWSFDSVLPYFQKIETYLGENKTMRGQHGPIQIIQRTIQPFEHKLQALFHTAINYGLPFNSYQNGVGPQYGVGIGETNVGTYKNGKHGLFNTSYYRQSSSHSYVRNIGLPSKHLTVWYNTTVQRILFDNNHKINKLPNAIGVEYWSNTTTNTIEKVYCNKEVIISAGTYQSPQLLMLSGIGPINQLNKFNISPISINNNIGKHGQDHIYLRNFKYATSKAHAAPKGTLINKYFNKSKKRIEYFYIQGRIELLLSSNKYNRMGYDYNDIRLSCYDGIQVKSNEIWCYMDTAVYSKNMNIELNSNDSRQYPNVYNNYFSDSRDYDTMIQAIHQLREIFAANKSIFIKEIYPGIDKTDQELRNIIFNDARTSIHGVGTLSMGHHNKPYSKQYPITSKCVLRGVNKLRVVDLSIWPFSINGGTQSLAFLIGEKCATHIIEESNEHNIQLQLQLQRTPIITINNYILFVAIIAALFSFLHQFIYKYYGKHTYFTNVMLMLFSLYVTYFIYSFFFLKNVHF